MDNEAVIKNPKVVIIKGSRSDRKFCQVLGSYIQSQGYGVIHRTGSAHRTLSLVQNILSKYKNSSEIAAIVSVAGLSDALSGTAAANTEKLVIAYPPDLEKYGDAKIFSSTKTPGGKVHLAKSPEEVVQIIKEKSAHLIYSPAELKGRQMKIVETYFTDNQDMGLDTPLGLPLFKKGKVRDVYDLGDELLINSTDRISAFDVNSVTEIEGKGMSLNLFSAWWFGRTLLAIPNHLIDVPDVTMMLAKKAERIDIEWVMRGYIYGSLYREYAKGNRRLYGHDFPNGLQLAEKLPEPILTPTTKSEFGHDIPITINEAIKKHLIKSGEANLLEEACFKLYKFYSDKAEEKGFIVPDFKLEFGRYKGELLQIDEAPNHDSARFWVKKYYEVGRRQEAWCADKEYYRQFLIDSGIDAKNPPDPLPEIPELVVREIQKRLGIYEVFTRGKSLDDIKLRSLEEVEAELGIKKPN
jgi:phosphoribosylaminoimidazole-succinocarboxamide synthase